MLQTTRPDRANPIASRERAREVKDRCRIEDIAARYTEVKRSGPNRFACRCLCGENTDRNPSFMLYPRGNDFHCFACGAHGSVIDLVMLAERCDLRAALESLERESGGAVVDRKPMRRLPSPSRGPKLLSPTDRLILNASVECYHAQLLQAHKQFAYLTDMRGLTIETIRRLKIGYSDGRQLIRYIHARGLPIARLADIGLITAQFEEMMRQRIVFPVWRGDDAVYLIGRATQPWQAEVKYLGLNNEVVSKQPMVAGAARRGSILVEGAVDFAVLLQWGLDREYLVIGLLGTAFDFVLEQLVMQMSPDAFICTDQDWAGKVSAAKVATALQARGIRPHVLADVDRHALVSGWVARVEKKARLTNKERRKLSQGRSEVATMQAMIKRNFVQWVRWGNKVKDPGDLGEMGEQGRQMFLAALKATVG